MNKPAAPATEATSPKVLPKKIIALTYLLTRSLVQLEALRLYGDTCLNTTISDLANQHGLVFIRKREPHQHRSGGTVYFMRYTLSNESQEAAQALVDRHKTAPLIKKRSLQKEV